MATSTIDTSRIQPLNDADPKSGDYVLYWMQQSQRATTNHALEYAVQQANDRGQRLLVAFGLTDDYPEANLRHYAFLLEGLQHTARALADRGMRFVVQRGRPDAVAKRLARRASLVVCDRGYLRHQRRWRRDLARALDRTLVQVESDVVVPVEVVSDKVETAARTIRSKLARHRDEHLAELRTTSLAKDSTNLGVDGDALDLEDVEAALGELSIDRSVPQVGEHFRGGTSQARARLRAFVSERLARYARHRSEPGTDDVSHLSPYLHFGQISPLEVALAVRGTRRGSSQDRDDFLEELIVRRELACNFVRYERHYDSWRGLPEWARKTLTKHEKDDRPHRYTKSELEAAETHDRYWNAAMREMKHTGYMHNHMRMYWGKKILEWCNTPRYAHRITLELNNKYFLDGRDPSSYANVAWVFGRHDRPWPERPVFGKVRSMTAGGLERKCDIDAYVEKVRQLTGQEVPGGDEEA